MGLYKMHSRCWQGWDVAGRTQTELGSRKGIFFPPFTGNKNTTST